MKPLVFLDLDDTLFQTVGKCPSGSLKPAAFGTDGQPLSFMAEHQCGFFDFLISSTNLVPTTGRNCAAYQRVSLPFTGYSICSHGGLILNPDGTPETRWRRLISENAIQAEGTLHHLAKLAKQRAKFSSIDVRARVIEDDQIPLYVSIKHNSADADELKLLAEALRSELPPDWMLHLNGNNMAFLPPFVSKRKAVKWFLQNLASPSTCTLGIGDSLSDLNFMSICDFAMAPTKSQLFQRMLRDSHEL